MSRIVLSLGGRGREHWFRAFAILEILVEHHDVLLIVTDAVDTHLRASCLHFPRLQVFDVSKHTDSTFQVFVGEQIRSRSTIRDYANFWQTLALVENRVQRFSPDLLITGFEPILPRVGRRLKIRTLCVDYQHLIDDIDPGSLPFSQRTLLAFARMSSRVYCPPVDLHVVSSFHSYPARQRGNDLAQNYRRVGVLLRSELQQQTAKEKHLLVKFASQGNEDWLRTLFNARIPARVYGFRGSVSNSQLIFRNTTDTFADDLLSCAGVITNGSNQLIGEALACGKPVLAMPNAASLDKQISTHFLSTSGIEGTMTTRTFTERVVNEFYDVSSQMTESTTRVPIANGDLQRIIDQQLIACSIQ